MCKPLWTYPGIKQTVWADLLQEQQFLHWISECFPFPCNLCDCRACASVWELEIRIAEENQTFRKSGSPSKWLASEGSKTNGFQTLQMKIYSREYPNEQQQKNIEKSKESPKHPHIYIKKTILKIRSLQLFLSLINLKKNP